MKIVHSIWAILALLVLSVATINTVTGYFQRRQFTNKDFKLGLITLILTHTQFLIGIIAYLAGAWYLGLSEIKNSGIRLLTLEHPLVMILAIISITIGWSKHKNKRKSELKFKTLAIFYSIGLILVLTRLPWSGWFNTWFA